MTIYNAFEVVPTMSHVPLNSQIPKTHFVGFSLGSVPRFQYSLQKATEQSVPPALAAKHGNLPCAEWWRKTSRIWKLLDRQLGDICWTWLLKFAWCLDGLPVCFFCCKSRWLLETNIYIYIQQICYHKYIVHWNRQYFLGREERDTYYITWNNVDWHSPWGNHCCEPLMQNARNYECIWWFRNLLIIRNVPNYVDKPKLIWLKTY